MKPRPVTRVIASILAVVGLYWSMMLILTLFVPPVGIVFNLLYLPGWISFIGWCQIIGAHQMRVRLRTFWLFSGISHIYLAFITHTNDYFQPIGEGIITAVHWCLFVSLISFVCACLENETKKSNGAAENRSGAATRVTAAASASAVPPPRSHRAATAPRSAAPPQSLSLSRWQKNHLQ